MSKKFQDFPLTVFFTLALAANVLLWNSSSKMQPRWANVPPPPTAAGLSASFLGDREMAYRTSAVALQSFGNGMTEVQALKDYNYDYLRKWFFLADKLNHKSDYVPFLAAYYFGATQNPQQLYPVIDYLRTVGKYPEKNKWWWLGQAVYLARHKLNDQKFALQLAEELAGTYHLGMPAWPLQMKAIIASDIGDKELAYGMMVEMLKSGADTMPPQEINFMLDYICNHILTPVQKGKDALCQGR
ncbi:MAG TPA: hypothetical protein PKI93_04190 [Alphaproteobacteria bacterium]|nr:hypothetical protein [Alphaproteobacteria bacterium]HNS44639.1 hypothetical protein [Alphaproteobacteria bacterium]